jgi:F-type H+-transporting ATPase subunit b
MQEILHQLLELFIEAVPTVVIVFLFFIFMRSVFFKPIMRAMDERKKGIEGAKVEAEHAREVAQHEMDRYHEAIRKARGEIYGEQETIRQGMLEERAKLLRTLRAHNQQNITAAKERIAAEVEAARANIQLQAPQLADEIAKSILEQADALPERSR